SPSKHVVLQSRCAASKADACPAPGRVDVVGERNDEAWPVALDSEPAAKPLERRVGRSETGTRGAKGAIAITRALRLLDLGEMDRGGLEIVGGEDCVCVRWALRRRSLAGKERDRPAFAVSVHLGLGRRLADQIGVGESRQIHPAGGGKTVPLPESRVDLHQL